MIQKVSPKKKCLHHKIMYVPYIFLLLIVVFTSLEIYIQARNYNPRLEMFINRLEIIPQVRNVYEQAYQSQNYNWLANCKRIQAYFSNRLTNQLMRIGLLFFSFQCSFIRSNFRGLQYSMSGKCLITITLNIYIIL